MFKHFVYPVWIIFILAYVHWKRIVIVFVAQFTCCILVILTYTMSFVHVTFQTNGVRMWLDREEENLVDFLLFSCYTQKLWEWFALLLAFLVIPKLAQTCWVCTFSCLSRERTIHYTIMLIPTVFLPYALVSNCYLVTIFFIRIIREKFKFTSHAHSWSFANIIVVCWLGSIHVIYLSCYYRERTELKWKIYMIRPFPNKNWHEFQNVYIHPRSAVDSAQWDLGVKVVMVDRGLAVVLLQWTIIDSQVNSIVYVVAAKEPERLFKPLERVIMWAVKGIDILLWFMRHTHPGIVFYVVLLRTTSAHHLGLNIQFSTYFSSHFSSLIEGGGWKKSDNYDRGNAWHLVSSFSN